MRKYIYILCFALLAASCTPVKKLKYVQSEGDESYKNEYYNNRSEKTIQPYDYLYIKIYSLDEKTNNIFNPGQSYMQNVELLSYIVDDKGNLSIPFIGLINVKDLTITQAKETIEKSLSVYLNSISVMIRFVSNKITILGEVNLPGQYLFYDEKVTVFQAVGFAHGVNAYGNLSSITLVREKDNNIRYYNLDLTKRDIAQSDFYYLLPNDVIIVNPVNAKYRELRGYYLNLTAMILTTANAFFNAYQLSRQIK
jgi:polysaccharide biosynthesis/export protein